MLSWRSLRQAEIESFWRRVQRGLPDECWPWTGGTRENGYGAVTYGVRPHRETTTAQRIAYVLMHPDEELASVEVVRHSCDNPPCCNPDHLIRGTQVENSADMFARGRQPSLEVQRASQAASAAARKAAWERNDLPVILAGIRGMTEPRTAKNCERLVSGYSYARHVYGHRGLVEMATA